MKAFIRNTLAFFAPFIHHIVEWSEAYLILPLTILFIELAKVFYFYQTGRSPTISEGGLDWIMGMAPRAVQIACAITFTSIFQQASGVWMSLEDQKEKPSLAIANKILRFLVFVTVLYFLAN